MIKIITILTALSTVNALIGMDIWASNAYIMPHNTLALRGDKDDSILLIKKTSANLKGSIIRECDLKNLKKDTSLLYVDHLAHHLLQELTALTQDFKCFEYGIIPLMIHDHYEKVAFEFKKYKTLIKQEKKQLLDILSEKELKEIFTLELKDVTLEMRLNAFKKIKATTEICLNETLSPRTIKHVKNIIDITEKHGGSVPPEMKKRVMYYYNELLFDDIVPDITLAIDEINNAPPPIVDEQSTGKNASLYRQIKTLLKYITPRILSQKIPFTLELRHHERSLPSYRYIFHGSNKYYRIELPCKGVLLGTKKLYELDEIEDIMIIVPDLDYDEDYRLYYKNFRLPNRIVDRFYPINPEKSFLTLLNLHKKKSCESHYAFYRFDKWHCVKTTSKERLLNLRRKLACLNIMVHLLSGPDLADDYGYLNR